GGGAGSDRGRQVRSDADGVGRRSGRRGHGKLVLRLPMSTLPKTHLTPEQYLEIERQAEVKSEYFQGEMFAMAGVSFVHNRRVWKLIQQFGPQLENGPCQGTPSVMKVCVGTGLFTYPDVAVVCGEPQFLDQHGDVLLNPSLIIEVLSPSTEAYDRGMKLA